MILDGPSAYAWLRTQMPLFSLFRGSAKNKTVVYRTTINGEGHAVHDWRAAPSTRVPGEGQEQLRESAIIALQARVTPPLN